MPAVRAEPPLSCCAESIARALAIYYKGPQQRRNSQVPSLMLEPGVLMQIQHKSEDEHKSHFVFASSCDIMKVLVVENNPGSN